MKVLLKRRGRRGFRKGRRGKPSLRSFAIPLASFALKSALGPPHRLSFDTAPKRGWRICLRRGAINIGPLRGSRPLFDRVPGMSLLRSREVLVRGRWKRDLQSMPQDCHRDLLFFRVRQLVKSCYEILSGCSHQYLLLQLKTKSP